ncbi:ClpP/crotonase [Lenzites betulinus]|nr:ClpP/crotonase [Lenzites betulinus]
MPSNVSLEVSQGVATITLNSPHTLNAFTLDDYKAFATALREADKRDDVLVTIWQANGRWFSAGTSVVGRPKVEINSTREAFMHAVVPANTDVSHALYTHSKILVAALNGPAMGISAAYLGHCDFIYALPSVWLSVPFTFLGIIAEAGSSVSFRNRMGAAKANEMLMWGKKKEAQELLECGFINKILPDQTVPEFHAAIRKLVLAELDGLDPTALLNVKKLVKAGLNDQNNFDAVNLRESYAQAERIASGIPAERFMKIAKKELRHKL